MTREQILPFKRKVVTIKFKTKYGEPYEATGRLIEINGAFMYLRLFGANQRIKIQFTNIAEIKEAIRPPQIQGRVRVQGGGHQVYKGAEKESGTTDGDSGLSQLY